MQRIFTQPKPVLQKSIGLILCLIILLSSSEAQISLNTRPASYSNNFNSYNPSGAAAATSTMNSTGAGSGLVSATASGWTTSSSGTASYQGQGTGSGASGGNYGFGSAGNFSLGALRSGTPGNISYTISFVNNTGAAITTLTFQWDYRQFRFANTSGWNVTGTDALASNTTINSKDFTGAASGTGNITTGVAAFTVTGLSIANGAAFGLTWITTDESGADNGVAIDNFSMSAPVPTITPATNAFTAMTTTYGTASAARTVVVAGTNLTANIIATAATGFEVSSNGTSFSSTATFAQTSGSASGTLSVRLRADAAAGSYNNVTVVTVTSTNATSRNFTTATTGNTVTARVLTISNVTAADKIYDGLTAANLSGTPAYTGLQNSQTFAVTGTPAANFQTAASGLNKQVVVTGYTAPSANYTVTQPTLTADITAAPLSITGISVNNKIYDGNNSATLTGTASYAGLQNGESFSVSGSPVATFNDAMIGDNKPVLITGYTSPNGNYSLTQPTGLTANILGLAIATADFRTKAGSNFSSINTWEYNQGGNSWIDATQVPSAGNNVLLLHAVVLDQNFSVGTGKNFVIATGGSFTVDAQRTFDIPVGANADFGGQPVTFKSTLAGTASLGKVSGTLTNATNVTVERYIPDNAFRSWRLLSVPTHGNAQTIRQAWQEGDSNPAALDNNFAGYGTQITGPGAAAALPATGFDAISLNASLQKWNGIGWTDLTTTNTPIDADKLYALYIRGDRSRGISSQINNASATTLRTTGSIYVGDQTVAAIPSNSFGLVPNLYPSAIDFLQVNKSTGISNLFYIWDSKKQFNNSLGVYQVFDEDLDYKCLIPGGSYSTSTTNTIIESGQPFFVKNSSTEVGSVTTTENSKVSGTNGNLGFRPANNPASIGKFFTRLYSGTNIVDANAVKFGDNYLAGVDGYDAPKLENSEENFAVERAAAVFVIEARPRITATDTVFFKMWKMQPKNYTLEFEAASIDMPGLVAILEDTYLHTNTPVNLTAISSINFTVTTNPLSYAANRFRLVFYPSETLAVTFISVNVAAAATGINVNWKVSNEQNIVQYDIERSLNGRDFIAAGQVRATNNAGTLLYNFTDVATAAETVFYRIKSINDFGDVKYSPIVKVTSGKQLAAYVVSPNPIRNGVVNLQINNQLKGRYTVRIVNNLGQAGFIKTIDHQTANSTYAFTLPATFTTGIYNADITSPDAKKSTIKLMID